MQPAHDRLAWWRVPRSIIAAVAASALVGVGCRDRPPVPDGVTQQIGDTAPVAGGPPPAGGGAGSLADSVVRFDSNAPLWADTVRVAGPGFSLAFPRGTEVDPDTVTSRDKHRTYGLPTCNGTTVVDCSIVVEVRPRSAKPLAEWVRESSTDTTAEGDTWTTLLGPLMMGSDTAYVIDPTEGGSRLYHVVYTVRDSRLAVITLQVDYRDDEDATRQLRDAQMQNLERVASSFRWADPPR